MRFSILLVPVAALGLLASCGDNPTSSDASTTTVATPATPATGAVDTGPTTTVAGAYRSRRSRFRRRCRRNWSSPTSPRAPARRPSRATRSSCTTSAFGRRTVPSSTTATTAAHRSPSRSVSVRSSRAGIRDSWESRPVAVGSSTSLPTWPTATHHRATSSRPATRCRSSSMSLRSSRSRIRPTLRSISIPPTPNQTEQTSTDLVVGDGPVVEPGQTVTVEYQAFSAADGKPLDSSWESGAPLTFKPGAGQLPPGLEKAVDGMKVGGRRQVTHSVRRRIR